MPQACEIPTSATCQNQITCTSLNQPMRKFQTKATQASGDYITLTRVAHAAHMRHKFDH